MAFGSVTRSAEGHEGQRNFATGQPERRDTRSARGAKGSYQRTPAPACLPIMPGTRPLILIKFSLYTPSDSAQRYVVEGPSADPAV